MPFWNKNKKPQHAEKLSKKKSKNNIDLENEKAGKTAKKVLRKLGVKGITPAAAIQLAQDAAKQQNSLVVEIPNAHGFLVVCLDGYDIHDRVKLDDPKGNENYDKQAMGQLAQLLIDSRKIASVTLLGDRDNGFIAVLPTKTTLESFMSIDGFADHANDKLFTWALLPNDIDENTPTSEQTTRSVNDDQCHVSLAELLQACDDNVKPEYDVKDGNVISVTLPDLSAFNSSTSSSSSSTIKTVNDQSQSESNTSNNNEVSDNQKATDVSNDATENDTDNSDPFAGLAEQTASDVQNKKSNKKAEKTPSMNDMINQMDENVGDNPFSNQKDQVTPELDNNNQSDQKDPFSDLQKSSEQLLNNPDFAETQVNDKIPNVIEPKSNVDESDIEHNSQAALDVELNAHGKFAKGMYAGLTPDQAQSYIMANGFDVSPKEHPMDFKEQHEDSEPVSSVKHDDDIQQVVTSLNDYQANNDLNDLHLDMDDSKLRGMIERAKPLAYSMNKMHSDHDELTSTMNHKKSILNDQIRELTENNGHKILSDYSSNLTRLFNNTQQIFSLSNMNNYGARKAKIDHEYERSKAASRDVVKKRKQAILDQNQQACLAYGEAAKQQAMSEWNASHKNAIDQEIAAVEDEVNRKALYDHDRQITEMLRDRQEKAHLYWDDKKYQLDNMYINIWNTSQKQVAAIFNKGKRSLDQYADDHFAKQVQHDSDVAEIRRNDNQINELKQQIKNQENEMAEQKQQYDNQIQVLKQGYENDQTELERKHQQELADVRSQDAAQHATELNHVREMANEREANLESQTKLKIKNLQDQINDLTRQNKELTNKLESSKTDLNKALQDQQTIANTQTESLRQALETSRNENAMLTKQLADAQKGHKSRLWGTAIATGVAASVLAGGIGVAAEAHHANTEIHQAQVERQQAEENNNAQNNNGRQQNQTGAPNITYNMAPAQQQTSKATLMNSSSSQH